MNKFGNMSAASIWEKLRERREPFILRAEEAAAFTIPSLFPRGGHDKAMDFLQPRQAVGAQAVNSLANKISSVVLPPAVQFFRLVPDKAARDVMDELEQEVQAEIEASFLQIEKDVRNELEAQNARPSIYECCEHLVVTGNGLLFFADEGGVEFFPLHRYVAARDASGNLVALVLKEHIAKEALTDEQRDVTSYTFDSVTTDEHLSGNEQEGTTVYTKAWLDTNDSGKKKWFVRQEINGAVVEGSEGDYVESEFPYLVLRWKRVKGEEYGRGICEEYIGSLKNVELLSKAIVEGSVAASRILPLIDPAGITNIDEISKARNGEPVSGNSEDITFMSLDKYPDFQFAAQVLRDEKATLQSAFLMTASVTRDAERVTAEEIRLMARELESSLGGVYTNISAELQYPMVRLVMAQLKRRGLLPKISALGEKHLHPTILAGVDALGRREELERLMQAITAFQAVVGPEGAAQYMNPTALAKIIFTSAGVDQADVIRPEDEVQAMQQQAAVQERAAAIAKGAAGPAVTAAAQNPELAGQVVQAAQEANG